MLLRWAFLKNWIIYIRFNGEAGCVSCHVIHLALAWVIIVLILSLVNQTIMRGIMIGGLLDGCIVLLLGRFGFIYNKLWWSLFSLLVVISHEDWLEAGSSLPRDQVPVNCNSAPGLCLLREIFPLPIIVVVTWLLIDHDELVSVLLNQVKTAAQVWHLEVCTSHRALILLMLLLEEHAFKVQ